MSSLTAARKIQVPTTFLLTERHVSWSSSSLHGVVHSSLNLLTWFSQGPCSYVVGSMTVTNQSSNHLPGLFLCSQITSRIATLLGPLFRGVSSLRWWGHDENAFRPLPLTECRLQARDWTFWDIICTFRSSHLQLIHITWANGQSWGSDTSVHAQRYVPAIVSCHPHIFFDHRSSCPC